jgi:hypothetical protein
MPGERSSIMSLSTADLSRAAANVRIPGDVGRWFHSMWATDCGVMWAGIPL